MSEFKVGDRVRVKDIEFEGIVDEVLRMEIPNYVGSLQGGTFYNSYRVISEDKYYTGLEENMLELIERPKAINPEILQELEQRIEKLEKYSGMGKYATDRKENVSNFEKMTQKSNLLSEDERVILRNLEDDYKWIVRDETGWLTIHEMYPYINIHHRWVSNGDSNFFDLFNHIFQFIKWGDKPYNIEELLKGECGNE